MIFAGCGGLFHEFVACGKSLDDAWFDAVRSVNQDKGTKIKGSGLIDLREVEL